MTPTATTVSPSDPHRIQTYSVGSACACPACGERQWFVGRIMAECAICETALPINSGYRGWSMITGRKPASRGPLISA
ncbi:MAG: hypothetical protein DI606_09690 [Sphingobium sp.]|nr:MAG: hypothetical protein DI606_09690 [Sphingobium sp.]